MAADHPCGPDCGIASDEHVGACDPRTDRERGEALLRRLVTTEDIASVRAVLADIGELDSAAGRRRVGTGGTHNGRK